MAAHRLKIVTENKKRIAAEFWKQFIEFLKKSKKNRKEKEYITYQDM